MTAEDPVWTCEIDSKARASQRDAVPDTACKFENIEHFIHAGALAEMKKVKGKHGGQKVSEVVGHCQESDVQYACIIVPSIFESILARIGNHPGFQPT